MASENTSAHKFSKPSSRGFFFTILALLLLSFMLISVQTWSQTQQLQERRSAERFRVESFKSTLAFVDANALAKFTNASALFAMHRLASGLATTACPNSDGLLPYSKGPRGEFPDGTYYVNKSIGELMMYGTTFGEGQFTCYGGNLSYAQRERRYVLSDYFKKTSEAAKVLGYNLTWGEPENFTINQSAANGPWIVTVSYDIDTRLTDSSGLSLARTIHVKSKTDINGLIDPFITGMDRIHRPLLSASIRPQKQVFHIPAYGSASDASARVVVDSSTHGLGWFFGPVAENVRSAQFKDTSFKYNLSKIDRYILYTNDGRVAVAESGNFGGIILAPANPPDFIPEGKKTIGGCEYNVEEQDASTCMYCMRHLLKTAGSCGYDHYELNMKTVPRTPVPYIIVPSLDLASIKDNYNLGLPEVLINNKKTAEEIGLGDPDFKNYPDYMPIDAATHDAILGQLSGESAVWNLNGPRDMAICGYYVQSTNGPSYLKRFTNPSGWDTATFGGAYSPPGIGIESFVVGTWAGGKADNPGTPLQEAHEKFSRLDWQFYADAFDRSYCGPYIKGMPGCKELGMCRSDDPRVNATGRFASNELPNLGTQYNLDPLNYTQIGGGITWRGCGP